MENKNILIVVLAVIVVVTITAFLIFKPQEVEPDIEKLGSGIITLDDGSRIVYLGTLNVSAGEVFDSNFTICDAGSVLAEDGTCVPLSFYENDDVDLSGLENDVGRLDEELLEIQNLKNDLMQKAEYSRKIFEEMLNLKNEVMQEAEYSRMMIGYVFNCGTDCNIEFEDRAEEMNCFLECIYETYN